jgi:hypothetical protein
MKFIDSENFEVSSYWPLSGRKNTTSFVNGSDRRGVVKYTFNKYGFRGKDINNTSNNIIFIGDSIVEGIFLEEEKIFPHILSDKLDCEYFNMGMSGRGNDYISRGILNFVEIINPLLVIIVFSNQSRHEYVTDDGNFEPFMPYQTWGYFDEYSDTQSKLEDIRNENLDTINFYRNFYLIKYYLKSLNIPFLWNGSFVDNIQLNDDNRFDGSFDVRNPIDFADDNTHPGENSHRVYAGELYQHITKKCLI